MSHLRALLLFATEVSGIIVCGYFAKELLDLSPAPVIIGVVLIMGMAFVKFLMTFSKPK
jgi:hypothetical protein